MMTDTGSIGQTASWLERHLVL